LNITQRNMNAAPYIIFVSATEFIQSNIFDFLFVLAHFRQFLRSFLHYRIESLSSSSNTFLSFSLPSLLI
jgi:hypothetical protein